MSKILWFDVETTGLDPARHGIWQLAFLIEIDGKVVRECNFKMNPTEVEYDEKALEIGNVTRKELEKEEYQSTVFARVLGIFREYISPFDKSDKFIPAGYNIKKFDIPFLFAWWERNHDPYLGAFLHFAHIDPGALVGALAGFTGYELPKQLKLGQLCKEFGVSLD